MGGHVIIQFVFPHMARRINNVPVILESGSVV